MTGEWRTAAQWCGIESTVLELSFDAILSRDGELAIAVLEATVTEYANATDGAGALADLLGVLKTRAARQEELGELDAVRMTYVHTIAVANAAKATLTGARAAKSDETA